jgi:small nuclear ribonucleoprotein E
MNLVIDDAVEVKLATKSEEESRRYLGELYRIGRIGAEVLTDLIGQILLKGDNVSLIQSLQG